MASFTTIGDVLETFVSGPNVEVRLDISGTYNMTILFQREQGSRSSGVWETLQTFNTEDQTESITYMTRGSNENLRLFLEVDDGGTATVTLAEVVVSSVRGALVTLTADETTANYTSATAIPFDQEDRDTEAIHDNSTNNSRLTVPLGVTEVKLSGNIALTLTTSADFVNLVIRKNGSADYIGCAAAASEVSSTFSQMNVSSPVLTVTSGDYFELYLTMETDTSITVFDDRSWFEMEIVK